MGIFVFIGLVSTILVGGIVVILLNFLFKDSAWTRLLKVIVVPISCILYVVKLFQLFGAFFDNYSFDSMNKGLIVLVAPIGIFIVLSVISYIFSGKRRST